MERIDLDFNGVMIDQRDGIPPSYSHMEDTTLMTRTSQGVHNSATRSLASSEPLIQSAQHIMAASAPVMPSIMTPEITASNTFSTGAVEDTVLSSAYASSSATTKGKESVYENAVSPLSAAAKRLFDIFFSIIGLIVFAPVMLLIHFAIYFDDGLPTFFHQERIGFKGRRFTLYKFRTMRLDAEAEDHPMLSTKEDDRTTRVGRWLRDHHLDELPQLWNVLRGDMSFVGYRPERQYFIDKIMKEDSRYEYLYQLRPGLFSMATLRNGYTDTMAKMLTRLEMDLDYLTNRSLMEDVKIIALTALSIISGKKF